MYFCQNKSTLWMSSGGNLDLNVLQNQLGGT